MSGAAEDIAAKALELADQRRAQEAREQRAFTRRLPDGTLEAVPNSLAPGTPRR